MNDFQTIVGNNDLRAVVIAAVDADDERWFAETGLPVRLRDYIPGEDGPYFTPGDPGIWWVVVLAGQGKHMFRKSNLRLSDFSRDVGGTWDA